MADLQVTVEKVEKPEADLMTESDASEVRQRVYNRAERLLEERLDELAIENYDREYSYAGDCYDEETNIKIAGFADQEKLEEWKGKMKSVF